VRFSYRQSSAPVMARRIFAATLSTDNRLAVG
jgi:hypothetical protein